MPASANRVAVVVLAAGESARMGENKLLLPWKGKPILVHVLETALRASALHSVAVVLGCDGDRVLDALERHFGSPLPFAVVRNPDWKDGQSASLRRGLAHILEQDDAEEVGGVMFLLGDQPLLRVDTLDRLLAAHGEGCPATAPVYRGRRGNPAILARELFPRIAELRGDTGARRILDGLGGALRLVDVDDPGVLRDIDSPDAYGELCRDG